MTVRDEFKSRKVDDAGQQRIQQVREVLSHALASIEALVPQGGRELAIVKTKLEEAGFFAVKAVSAANELKE